MKADAIYLIFKHFIYTYEVNNERYTSKNNYNLETFLYSRISHANHLNIFETYFGFITETVRRICKLCVYTYAFVYRVGCELYSHTYSVVQKLASLQWKYFGTNGMLHVASNFYGVDRIVLWNCNQVARDSMLRAEV